MSVEYIENLRIQKVYKLSILGIINDEEFVRGWWDNTLDDRKSAEEFIKKWNNKENFPIDKYHAFINKIEKILENNYIDNEKIKRFMNCYYHEIMDSFREGKEVEELINDIITES